MRHARCSYACEYHHDDINAFELDRRLECRACHNHYCGYAGAFGDVGTIQILNSFTWTAANLLTLKADHDIFISPGVVVQSTTASNVPVMNFQANIAGTAPGTFSAFSMQPGASLQSNGGNITVTAVSGSGGAFSEYGIVMFGGPASSITTNSGIITLNGTSQHTGGGSASGIEINGSLIQTTSGAINLTGIHTGNSAAFFQSGVQITNTSNVLSTSGIITINGTGKGTGSGGWVSMSARVLRSGPIRVRSLLLEIQTRQLATAIMDFNSAAVQAP